MSTHEVDVRSLFESSPGDARGDRRARRDERRRTYAPQRTSRANNGVAPDISTTTFCDAS
jgi:hypothetical protein